MTAIRVARAMVYAAGFAAIGACFVLFPELAREDAAAHPTTVYLDYCFLVAAYILATPFFLALYQSHKLLGLIDKGQAFSKASVRTLKTIKRCAIIFAVLMAVWTIGGVSWLRSLNPTEDQPPFMMLGSMIVFVAAIIATFVNVVERLFHDAIRLKAENDLTV